MRPVLKFHFVKKLSTQMVTQFQIRPFIPLSLAMTAGILAGEAIPGHRILPYALFFTVGFGLIRGIIQIKPVFFLICALCFSWGYISIQPYTATEFPPNHVIHHSDKNKWLIVGVVTDKPSKYKDKMRFTLRAETLGSSYTPVTGNIRVVTSEDIPDISAGDRISFVSRIKSLSSARNPGGFNYKKHMALKGIWATAHVPRNYPIDIEDDAEKGGFRNFRDEISEFIESTGPGDHVGILKALIIGDKSEISQELRKDFSRAGIAHILAISGLHIGIIAGLSFAFFNWLLCRIQFFSRRAWVIRGVAVLSWFPVITYGLLAGMWESNATQRAVIMLTVFLLSLVREKNHDSMNALGFSALLILLVHASALFSISFQFSFSAAFSASYGMSKIHHRRGELFSLFWVSLFATLGVLPLIMLYYNQISLVGLFANFVFIPVIGFAVIPLGLLSVALYPFYGQAASACIHISAFALRNTLEIVTPTYLEIFCFYTLLWAVLEIRGYSETFSSGQRSVFRRNVARWAAVLIVLILTVNAVCWLRQRFWHDELRVTVIDVGQGSAALLEFPGGSCLLADGGGSPDNAAFDVGERILTPFFLYKRIKTFDRIVLSHPHSDHFGGLLYILRNFTVRELWANGDASDETGYHDFTRIMREKQIDMPEFGTIPRKHEMGGTYLEILWPPTDFMDPEENEAWQDTCNNNSIVLKVTFGDISFLFPGDIEAEAEKELVRMAGDKLASTVLIAPHHGSRSSSTPEFLDAVRPEYVIISAGVKNRFHHPHPSVLRRYEERGCRIFRTDLNGAVSISSDGHLLNVRGHIHSARTFR